MKENLFDIYSFKVNGEQWYLQYHTSSTSIFNNNTTSFVIPFKNLTIAEAKLALAAYQAGLKWGIKKGRQEKTIEIRKVLNNN